MGSDIGKKFEKVVERAFLQVPGVSCDRLHDQTTGYRGSYNICDFIVYKKPFQIYIECKTVFGNVLPFRNVSDNQWLGLMNKFRIPGVFAGVLCWWRKPDVTKFIPILELQIKQKANCKSYRWDWFGIEVPGKKERVFYKYDMEDFLDRLFHSRAAGV